MFYIYILFSERDHHLYAGFTTDLKSRYSAHKNGFVKSTKNSRPLRLIYYEAYTSEIDAKRREKYFKGGNGRSDMKIQLQNTFTFLHRK